MVTTHTRDVQSIVTQKVLLEVMAVERFSQHLGQPQLNIQDLLSHTDSPTSLFTLLSWVKRPTLSKHMHLQPLKERLYREDN